MKSWIGIVIALAIACGSAYCSAIISDWTVFERSGSLIVIVGAWFFAFRFEAEIKTAVERYQDNKLKNLAATPVQPGSTEEMRKWINISQTLYEDAPEYISDAVRATIKRRETFVIISGTLIWGWGSYLGKLVSLFTQS